MTFLIGFVPEVGSFGWTESLPYPDMVDGQRPAFPEEETLSFTAHAGMTVDMTDGLSAIWSCFRCRYGDRLAVGGWDSARGAG